ncbi:NB-ARC domain-containing protein [Micromonospora profundi]|uniref:NB-ARC domain-containing protein n=1 Tax=Micromonospora profundi TaxID=1420889 RepID=UPI0036BD8DA2
MTIKARRLRLLVLCLPAAVTVVGTILALSINAASDLDRWPAGMDLIRRHPFWWTGGLTLVSAVLAVGVWTATSRAGERKRPWIFEMVGAPPSWVASRPQEVAAAVRGLRSRPRGSGSGAVVALVGHGGFGKTTLMQMICADRRIARTFGRRVLYVRPGQYLTAQTLAAKLDELTRLTCAAPAQPSTDPVVAAQHLRHALEAMPRTLLVIDDVWDKASLDPFLLGAPNCARLVTTRIPLALPDRHIRVDVAEMTSDQAEQVLFCDLPTFSPRLRGDLLQVCRGWPLLLRLVNRILYDHHRSSADAEVAAEELFQKLRGQGPQAADEPDRVRDLDDPEQRAEAVQASIEVGVRLLERESRRIDGKARLSEIAAFADDHPVPSTLVLQLWAGRPTLAQSAGTRLLRRMSDLTLIGLRDRQVTMHGVIREYLRGDLGAVRLRTIHQSVEAAMRSLARIPDAEPPVPGTSATQWWRLPETDTYAWSHLIWHLVEAGEPQRAAEVACDLRWITARLTRFGPAAPCADLRLVQKTARLQFATMTQIAHMLLPTMPPESVIDVLYSRIEHIEAWRLQIAVMRAEDHRAALVNRWPLPDLPDPAMRRVLHRGGWNIRGIAITPDDKVVVCGDDGGFLHAWDADTGLVQFSVTAHQGAVWAVAVSPDGALIATAGSDGRVRLWQAGTGNLKASLSAGTAEVFAVVFTPNGSWLAAAGADGQLRTWRTAAWNEKAATLPGHDERAVFALSTSPDSAWVCGAGENGVVMLWSLPDGQTHVETDDGLVGWGEPAVEGRAEVRYPHLDDVIDIDFAVDGRHLLTASDDTTVRWWHRDSYAPVFDRQSVIVDDPNSRIRRVRLAHRADFFTYSAGRTIHVNAMPSGEQRSTRHGHDGIVHALAISHDDTWIASAAEDGQVILWEACAASSGSQVRDWREVRTLAAAPDRSWVAVPGRRRCTLDVIATDGGGTAKTLECPDELRSVAVSPNGSTLVAVHNDLDGLVVWDTTTWESTTVPLDLGPVSVRFTPDNHHLVIGTYEGSVLRLETRTWRLNARYNAESDRPGPFESLAIDVRQRWIAATTYSGLYIWDFQHRTRIATVAPHHTSGHARAHEPRACTSDPQGRWVALAAGPDIRIFGGGDWTVDERLTCHYGSRVVALAASPDGRHLASLGTDRTVRITDTVSWQPAASMEINSDPRVCEWIGGDRLVIGGTAGLYLFDFRQ